MTKHDSGMSLLFDQGVVASIMARLGALDAERDSLLLFRLLHLLTALATSSSAAFERSTKAGAVDFLCKQLDVEDPLHRLSCLELLEQVAATPFGAEHLLSQGVLGRLLEQVRLGEDDLGGLIVARVVALFGNAARKGDAVVATLLKLPVLTVFLQCLERFQFEVRHSLILFSC